jgi:hypothetical protein
MPKKSYQKQKEGRRKFPGFETCMKMMRGEAKMPSLIVPEFDEAFGWLRSYALDYVDELVDAFYREENAKILWVIVELLGETRSVKALPVFTEALRGDDTGLWSWAIYGLTKLNTPEARRLLWDARSYSKGTEEDTRLFREQLGIRIE